MGKIRVTAHKRGTFISSATGGIHHFDPKGTDENARHPTVDDRDLDDLRNDGFIGDRAKGSVVDVARAPAPGKKVLERLAAAAEIDESAGTVASPAAAVALTAYPPSMNVGHDEPGLSDTDPDAPPIGGPAPAAAPPSAADNAPKPTPRPRSGSRRGKSSAAKG
jgi:hypothetical protein